MCDICKQHPCASRCPNNPREEEYIHRCEICDKKIYYGDKYAKVKGEIYCEECLNDFDCLDWLAFLGEEMVTAK